MRGAVLQFVRDEQATAVRKATHARDQREKAKDKQEETAVRKARDKQETAKSKARNKQDTTVARDPKALPKVIQGR